MRSKETVVVCMCLVLRAPAALADDPVPPGGWKATADVGLNVNQASYSSSWTGGEEASVAWTLAANLIAERQFKPTLNWRNTLRLAFGQFHREREDAAGNRSWESPEKSSDRVFFESLMRFTLGGFVDPYASVTFESQFYDATDARLTRYLNPILLTESAGIGRTFIKNERTEFYSRVGAALRQNIVQTVVGEDPDLDREFDSSLDGGAEWVTDMRHAISPQLNYTGRLRVFEAVFYSESDKLEGLPEEDYWKTPDVAWENTLSAAVAKYVQASLFFELLYDKQIDLRGRWREILGLGITYKLF